MRKLLSILLLLVLTTTAAKAQYFFDSADNYWGVRLGINASNLKMKGVSASKDGLAGMNLGVVYGILLTDEAPIYLEPGVMISNKGVKFNASKMSEKIRTRLTYLEVPVVFKYKIEEVAPDLSIEPFLGGFVSLGLGGKTKYYDSRKKHSSFRSNAYRSFDGGLRMGCGLGYQNLYVEMAYDLGLANVASDHFLDFGYDSFDDAIRTRCVTLNIGLNF